MQCRMQCQFDGKHRMYHGINRRSSQITQSSDQNVVACGLGLVFMLAVEWNIVFIIQNINFSFFMSPSGHLQKQQH